MDEYLKEALKIVTAQASVRNMTAEEMSLMLQRLSQDIRDIAEGALVLENTPQQEESIGDARKSIREKTITCLECGQNFKILTRRHLASHGLNAESYREKWKIRKDAPLVCRALQRDRRRKMKDMKLWEKRRKDDGRRTGEA